MKKPFCPSENKEVTRVVHFQTEKICYESIQEKKKPLIVCKPCLCLNDKPVEINDENTTEQSYSLSLAPLEKTNLKIEEVQFSDDLEPPDSEIDLKAAEHDILERLYNHKLPDFENLPDIPDDLSL